MTKKYKVKKIGVTALCRVSAKGGEGIYLYIPKNYADAYGIPGAEYAEVKFGKLFFNVAELPEKSNVKDWRNKSKRGGDDFSEGELE